MKLQKFRNKKSGKLYYVIDDNVVNTSTGADREVMVTYYGKELYEKHPCRFTRNKEEFLTKFTSEGMV
jgi:hypothetical protein